MAGGRQGIAPCRHLAPRILQILAVNYCACQLARRLGWVVPAYHEEGGATLHPGMWRSNLQYDGRPDGVRVGTWNLGSPSGKGR